MKRNSSIEVSLQWFPEKYLSSELGDIRGVVVEGVVEPGLKNVSRVPESSFSSWERIWDRVGARVFVLFGLALAKCCSCWFELLGNSDTESNDSEKDS